MASAWHWVTIGSADLEAALDFWADRLGLGCLARAEGDDPGLREHWAVTGRQIARQAMVRSAGAQNGGMHLVEWDVAADSVRAEAQVFDLCPKNLDIYVDDLPLRMAQLTKQGVVFRSDHYSEAVSPDGVHFREIHLAGHDDINIVFLQVIGSDTPIPESGIHGVGTLVCIVRDPTAEKHFIDTILELSLSHNNILEGPEIEEMIGLPAGCALEVSIWAEPGQPLGELELVTYQGTDGANRYPRAQPGARGITHLNWWRDDLEAFAAHLRAQGVPHESSKVDSSLFQSSFSLIFHSPAGLRLEVHGRADA
jgi:catechol 2,3-dioxygenase-like lactoylglutathione lyase family enzyme